LEYLTSSSLVQLDFKSTRLSAAAEFSKEFIQLHSLKAATDISQLESAPTAPAVS
jgi:hypothetical protein